MNFVVSHVWRQMHSTLAHKTDVNRGRLSLSITCWNMLEVEPHLPRELVGSDPVLDRTRLLGGFRGQPVAEAIICADNKYGAK